MASPALVVQDLTKQYRAGKRVIDHLSIRFEPGQATLLKGANGSGKTTFLRLLSANSWPTSGRVLYGDLDIHRNPHRYLHRVGLVHDQEGLPLHMSALELLEWLLRSRQKWDEAGRESIHRLLDRLELGEARREPVGTYSTGMKKKVQIAAALAPEPDLLILDEPLRGLDSTSTEVALDLFSEFVDRGAILLMATHSDSQRDGRFARVMKFPVNPDL